MRFLVKCLLCRICMINCPLYRSTVDGFLTKKEDGAVGLAEIRVAAREKLRGYCRVCPVCDGQACAGEVPGMGGAGTGESFKANIDALRRYSFNMRTIHGILEPVTSLELWGRQLSLPVLAAPITGTTYNMGGKMTEEDFAEAIIAGSLSTGSLGMTGDGADPTMFASGLQAIAKHGGQGIAIIKPRGKEEIIRRVRMAEDAGALAVGIDIDGAGLVTMALKGQPVGPKSLLELKEIISLTELPFIIKGIMTPDEAELAVEAGAAAIVVSNHGGRVLDFTPGTADVLQEISDRVNGRLFIFVDGGVRTGVDVLKLLALGAGAVLVGRPLIVGAFGAGPDGVAHILNKMREELFQAMLLTGTGDVSQVSLGVLF